MNRGSEEGPMASRKAIEDMIEKQMNEAKKPKQSCGVLDLHCHPVAHNEDKVLHIAWHRCETKLK